MTITNNIRKLIANRLLELDLNQSEFAVLCGKKKPWASKFFNGKIASMSDPLTDKVEEVLGMSLVKVTEHGRLSQNVLEFAAAMEDDERVSAAATAILSLYKDLPAPAPAPKRRSQTSLGALLLLAGACVGLLLGGLRSEPVVVQAPAADVKSELLELRAMVAALEVRGSAVASRTSAPATRSAKVQP